MLESMTCILAGGIIVALICAAWSDIATRLVPNAAGIAIAAMGMLSRAFVGPSALAESIAVSLGLFCVLAFAHAHGVLGGGDAKLLAATTIGLPPPVSLHLLAATALSGGILALIHLALRLLPHPACCPRGSSGLRRVWTIERWRIRRRGPMPYGVAIAAAGIWVLTSNFWS